MKVLKGFALALLNFLLFVSITALGLAVMLNHTLLNPEFITAELDKVDPYSLIEDQIKVQVPEEYGFMDEAIEATIADLRPWMREQAEDSVYVIHDYLTGESEELDLGISTQPVTDTMRDNLWEAFMESPPAEVAGQPPAIVRQYYEQFFEQEIATQVPATIEVNEDLLGPDVMDILEQVRRGIGHFQNAYKWLIVAAIVLVAGIILIYREVRGSSRSLGITFLTYGAIEYIGIFLLKHFTGPPLPWLGIPAELHAGLYQVLDDILVPLQWFSLGFLVAGVILIVFSHLYKRRQSDE